jgi:hypothetical protein
MGPLIRVVGCTLGVGLGVPAAATRAWQRCDAGSGGVWGEVCWNTVREAALGAGGGTEDEWHVAMGGLRKGAERLVLLDASAKARFLVLQFVDDAFIAQSSVYGLRAANRGLTRFADIEYITGTSAGVSNALSAGWWVGWCPQAESLGMEPQGTTCTPLSL